MPKSNSKTRSPKKTPLPSNLSRPDCPRRGGCRYAVIQRGNGSLSVRREMGRQSLYRNDAIKPRVPRAINLAHAARSHCHLEFVRTKFAIRGQSHRCAPL